MACRAQFSQREFQAVRADLERVVAFLKNKKLETIVRQRLLRELRILLDEADAIITAEQ